MIFWRIVEDQDNMINNKLHKQIVNNKVKTDLNNDHNDNKRVTPIRIRAGTSLVNLG